jgi:hypothetical protein
LVPQRTATNRLPGEIGDHSYFAYITVDDVDALHREFDAKGA